MLDLNQIERQTQALYFWNNVNVKWISESECLIWVVRDQVKIGHISIIGKGDGQWQVDWVECEAKGKGKLLYYIAMNEVFPHRLCPNPKRSYQPIWDGIAHTTKQDLFGYCLPRKLDTFVQQEEKPYIDIGAITPSKTFRYTIKPRLLGR